MDFEKKYWSKNEFIDEYGKSFVGFVGIIDGEAYDFINEKKLFSDNSYLACINSSPENFDRTLAHKLKLPFEKKDISFAVNDFMYGNIIETIVERLQANNDYIFRNSIISNSILPVSNDCTILSSLYESDENGISKNSGVLGKLNFNKSALLTKTEDDPAFYPQTGERYDYFVKDIFGKEYTFVPNDLMYIDTPEEIRDTTNDNYEDTSTTIKESWEKLHNNGKEADYENEARVYSEEAHSVISKYTERSYPENFEKIDYEFISIPGDFDDTPLTISEINLKFLPPALKNLIELRNDLAPEKEISVSISSLSFIIKGEIPLIKNIGDEDILIQSYNIRQDIKYVIYNFNKPYVINIPNNINYGNIFLSFDKEGAFFALNDNIKFDAAFTLGNLENYLKIYKNIPNVKREVQMSYIWYDDANNEHIAEPNISYKFLTESNEWRKEKSSRFMRTNDYSDEENCWGNGQVLFIPNDNMTAADVYAYMIENPDEYLYPAIAKKVIYTKESMQYNDAYKDKVYPVESYTIKDKKFVVSYKSPEEIYQDTLYLADILKKDDSANIQKLPFDKIPYSFTKAYIETIGTDKLVHNFNEIMASDICIKNIDTVKKSMELLIFLVFKTKLLIFKTKYYYGSTPNSIANPKEDINYQIDLSANGNYITIDHVNPEDNTSLEFLELNAIKIYKNMLYLVDSKLDMVVRYDIDYLVADDESEEFNTSFSIKSIKLLDIMQGAGDSSDKIYFNKPYSIDVNDDRVYILDRGNSCIKVYSPSLNFIKTIKNGFFASQDIQAIAVNPFPCIINDTALEKNSLWILSVVGTRMNISILENDIVKVYGQIEDITLLQDEQSWLEEVRGIYFSQNHSNYFYLNTSKRLYKFHVSKPFYPFASVSYFKQRSVVGTMRWSSMRYQWHKIPSVYQFIDKNPSPEAAGTKVTWNHIPPSSAAEILDNKCFCLAGSDKFEGDIIFHFGVLYDNNMIRDYISANKEAYGGSMTFYNIELGVLAKMIKSSAILLYREPDSFLSTITNPLMKIYDLTKIKNNLENDYINALTFNKMLHALVFNLLKIKNSLTGYFRAATNIDNVIVYDNIILSDYFNNLQIGNEENYLIHDNEVMSVIVNRTLENIYDLQEKIINKMQTEFMAAQSYVNNNSRII